MFVSHVCDLQLVLSSSASRYLAWFVDLFGWYLFSETHMKPKERCFGWLEQFLALYLHALVAELNDPLKNRLLLLRFVEDCLKSLGLLGKHLFVID